MQTTLTLEHKGETRILRVGDTFIADAWLGLRDRVVLGFTSTHMTYQFPSSLDGSPLSNNIKIERLLKEWNEWSVSRPACNNQVPPDELVPIPYTVVPIPPPPPPSPATEEIPNPYCWAIPKVSPDSPAYTKGDDGRWAYDPGKEVKSAAQLEDARCIYRAQTGEGGYVRSGGPILPLSELHPPMVTKPPRPYKELCNEVGIAEWTAEERVMIQACDKDGIVWNPTSHTHTYRDHGRTAITGPDQGVCAHTYPEEALSLAAWLKRRDEGLREESELTTSGVGRSDLDY